MIQLFEELLEKQNVRSNLSALRGKWKEAEEQGQQQIRAFVAEHEELFWELLESEDPKTRKNAALLLGDVAHQPALPYLYEAYEKEQTLFVKSAYLEAIGHLDASEVLPQLQKHLKELQEQQVPEENRKHTEAELRALRAILIRYEGIDTHHFDVRQQNNHVLLVTNRNHRGVVEKQTGGKAHPLGVLVQRPAVTASGTHIP